jgi:hypothetical protein
MRYEGGLGLFVDRPRSGAQRPAHELAHGPSIGASLAYRMRRRVQHCPQVLGVDIRARLASALAVGTGDAYGASARAIPQRQ